MERVHVLLDGKGKTLSHAYVEVKEPAVAGAILRGEAQSSGPSGKKERGSVLGRGRRARGVTITRSGQQELMTDVRVIFFSSVMIRSSQPLSIVVPSLAWKI